MSAPERIADASEITEPPHQPRQPQAVHVFSFPSGELRMRVRAFNPIYSTQLLVRLGGVIGGSFGAAISGMVGGDSLSQDQLEAMEGAAIERAVNGLFTRLETAGVENLLKDILCTVDIVKDHSGTPTWVRLDINRDFMLNEFGLIEVLIWAMKFHYQDFFTRSFSALVNLGGSGLKDKLKKIWGENSPSVQGPSQDQSSSEAYQEVSLGLSQRDLEDLRSQLKTPEN